MTAELNCPKRYGHIKFATTPQGGYCPLSGTISCEKCEKKEKTGTSFPKGTR